MLRERNKSGRRVSRSKPSPTGPAGLTVNLSSTDEYINFFQLKAEKSTCICPTCHATQAFATDYYQNDTILRDNDQLVHVPRVSK